MASRQVLGRDPLQRVRRRAREQFTIGALVAVEVDKLARLIAAQEAALPVLDA